MLKLEKKTECTGFLELITAIEEITVIDENRKKNKLIIINNIIYIQYQN